MERIDSRQNFIRLVDQYQNLIFSICLKMTGDYFVAEDLTQETFLTAYKHLTQELPEAEKAWLCRIAANKCIDYLRAAARRAIPTEEEDLHHLESADWEEPLKKVMGREILEELYACCRALPSPYREVALAHFLEGKNAKEIAEESGSGINTVKTHIRRSREMLKKTYRKELLQE